MATEVWWHPGIAVQVVADEAVRCRRSRHSGRRRRRGSGRSRSAPRTRCSRSPPNVLARTKNIDDKESIVAAIKATKLNTVFGLVTWKGGPAQNPVANTRRRSSPAAQWRKGKKYPYEMVVVCNKRVPGLKREGKLQPIVYR